MDERDFKQMNKDISFLKMKWFRTLCLIRLEYNSFNGFIFSFLNIEIVGKNKYFEGELLGLHISDSYFIIYLLFIEIEFKKPII